MHSCETCNKHFDVTLEMSKEQHRLSLLQKVLGQKTQKQGIKMDIEEEMKQ